MHRFQIVSKLNTMNHISAILVASLFSLSLYILPQTAYTQSLEVSGFTQLGDAASGAPKIKMKMILDSTSTLNNGSRFIPYGLTYSKIISATVLVQHLPGDGMGAMVAPGYTADSRLTYNFFITSSYLIIQNQASVCDGIQDICNKPARILITYIE